MNIATISVFETGSPVKKAQYYYLDIFKLFFSICVVAIHTEPLKEISNTYITLLYNFVVCFAVPFFFVSSGFLFGLNTDEVNLKFSLLKVRNKYIKLYIKWNIIYFPITIWGIYYERYGVIKSTLLWVRGFMFLGEQFCSWQLWYLLSVIIGFSIIKLIINKFDTIIPYFVIVFLFVVAWLFDNAKLFSPLITRIIGMTIANGRLFTGPAYLLLGVMVSRLKIDYDKLKLLLVGSIIVLLTLAVLFRFGYSYTYLPAIIITPLLVKYLCEYKTSKNGERFRRASQVIYFLHMYFYFIWNYSVLNFEKIHRSGISSFIFSIIMCILACLIDFWGNSYKHKNLVI